MSQLSRQELPAEDLGDLTRPKNRAAGLANLVNAGPPRAVRGPEQGADAEVPSSAESNAPAAPQATSASLIAAAPAAAPRTAARKPGRPRTRNKPTSAVYVSPGVKKRFEKYRHDNKMTNLTVILQAISAKHKAGELEGIINKSRYSTVPKDDLFPADPSAVRYLGGGDSQISFALTPEQEEVLDGITKTLGFETRSTWIAPVLNDFLPGKKELAAG
ncbi:hypothetical protein B7435_07080 [Mycolicibacterium peregrinum]|uniref:hypothetical protein n=1 Tax=Mycolicibacterium peregrinum TaxID=43304 RepID=UPI000B4AFE09|nr:hypothetical protein [Mycolicibacterium peregrinum]OWM07863.1 hypothetical protein B7435_07080 [Mycolicibacterium peregrinum]